MPASGSRLGVYEIVAQIGAGGMGEVFRARDTTLGREVAIKILPDAVAADPLRVARFEREARLLAALNHPHIAAIYGVGESGTTRFLVLELVDGESLAVRIARGRLPVSETLAVARQIAGALEAAHEKGIVHRDLKPANVMISADGQVKVLDFGLARHDAPETAAENATLSPTLTFQATTPGVILGTAAYMSPEQAKGRVADKRSDVWAFAAVIFEMLSGRRAFEGEDISETLAAIIRGEPDWSALPAGTPAWLVATLKRCLDKDRRTRIPDVAAVHFLIDEAPAMTAAAEAGAAPAPRGQLLPWAVASALGVGLIAAIALWAPWRKTPRALPLRASVELGADVSLVADLEDVLSLSPDGSRLAFAAQQRGGTATQLYVRPLNQFQAMPLAGTEGAHSPFFSPDGQWIGFFTADRLKKVAATGGAVVTLCDVRNGRGGAWGIDESIVFAALSVDTSRSGLLRVSSVGGTPETFTTPTGTEATHRWPQILPGGKGVLLTSSDATGDYAGARLVVHGMSGGAGKVVQRGGFHGRYVPSGHLVYLRDGTLFAAPFDLDRLEVSGQAVPLLEDLASNQTTAAAQFTVSASGAFAYVAGVRTGGGVAIDWLDRSGKTTPLRTVPARWFNIQIAPDGRRLALDLNGDIWIDEWARDTMTRFTNDPAADVFPVWTPDSRRIAFASTRDNGKAANLYWQSADGTGEVQRLTNSPNAHTPTSWDPSGRFLAFEEHAGPGQSQVMILPMEGDAASGMKPGTPTPFQRTASRDLQAMFSPDGKWLAYSSDESGKYQVYVRPFPGPGGKWQISSDGGNFATWSRTRPELFYATGAAQIMVVPFSVEAEAFRAEKPRLWSTATFGARVSRMFDLHPDGERFAIAPSARAADGGTRHVALIVDFSRELTEMFQRPLAR